MTRGSRLRAAVLTGGLALAVAAMAVTATPATTQIPTLEAVPTPSAGMLEPSVAEDLAAAHAACLAAEGAARPDAWGELGRLYAAYELWDAAAVALRNARKLAPEDAVMSYLLGYAEAQRGQVEDATTAFEHTTSLDPTMLAAWLRLGEMQRVRGHSTRARDAFSRARDLAPQSAAAHFGLGRVALRADRPEDAVKLLERARALAPEANQIHYPLATAYRRLGDLDAARRHLAARGEIQPSFPDPEVAGLTARAGGGSLHKFLGDQAVLAGRFAEAAAAYRRAVSANPDSFYAHKSLGLTLHRLGNPVGAREALSSALSRLSSVDETSRAHEARTVRLALGGIAVNQGDDAEARMHYEALLTSGVCPFGKRA